MIDELDDLLYDETEDDEELDLILDPTPTYFGIIVDEEEKEKNEIYAGDEIWFLASDDKYIMIKKQIDITGEELGKEVEVEFKTISDFADYLKKNNVRDCYWNLDNLKNLIV